MKSVKFRSVLCTAVAATSVFSGIPGNMVFADEQVENLNDEQLAEVESKVDKTIVKKPAYDVDSYINGELIDSEDGFEGTILRDYTKTALPIKYSSLADAFSSRESGYTTSVKSQNPLGICWDFAGTATLETFLKKGNYGTYDLSEEHMRWWAKGGEHDWDIGDNQGATNEAPIGYFTSWSGQKNEADIPFQPRSESNGAVKPSNYDSAPTIGYNVVGVMNISKDDTQSIKEAIYKYGAVISGYYDDRDYISDDKNSYYIDRARGQNHSITIVGWDDNYSKEKFTGKATPKNDGAWLIKNSWGNYNSEGGYMWISYEDRTIHSYSDNYAITKVIKANDEKIYQHEYSLTSKFQSEIITAANVFDFGLSGEKLKSVMFATDSKGASYNVYLADYEGAKISDERTLLASGTVPYSGYITVDADQNPNLSGKKAIIVEIDNRVNNKKSSIAIEMNINGMDMFVSKASLGQSYIKSQGEFVDVNNVRSYAPANVVIKAITTPAEGGNSQYGEQLLGADRYDTAIKVSKKGWESANTAILVNGNAIPDALSATPLAKIKDAPVLLTGSDTLNEKTKAELDRLGVSDVYIIGGENSISKTIENKLTGEGKLVRRVYGEDRFDTSYKIAEKIIDIKNTDNIVTNDVEKVAVVNGNKGLADAISFSPVAGNLEIPIILVNQKGELGKSKEIATAENIKKTYVIGGENSIAKEAESAFTNPQRISGLNRNDTNAKIIESFYINEDMQNAYVVKNGQAKQGDLIDGLSVGSLAAKNNCPIIVTNGDLNEMQQEVLQHKTIEKVVRVGGGNNLQAYLKLVQMQSDKENTN